MTAIDAFAIEFVVAPSPGTEVCSVKKKAPHPSHILARNVASGARQSRTALIRRPCRPLHTPGVQRAWARATEPRFGLESSGVGA
jgi:hypothetical protein